jgi:hypothetical protein
MCETCDAYADSIATPTPAELDAVLKLARKAVDDGDLELMDHDRAFAARHGGEPLPRERPVISRWMCTECSRMFLLEINSCHVGADGWRPLFGN